VLCPMFQQAACGMGWRERYEEWRRWYGAQGKGLPRSVRWQSTLVTRGYRELRQLVFGLPLLRTSSLRSICFAGISLGPATTTVSWKRLCVRGILTYSGGGLFEILSPSGRRSSGRPVLGSLPRACRSCISSVNLEGLVYGDALPLVGLFVLSVEAILEIRT
jgi:hypothetical protein